MAVLHRCAARVLARAKKKDAATAVAESRPDAIFHLAGVSHVLTAQADQGDVELLWKLLENEPGTEVTVDLEQQTISARSLPSCAPPKCLRAGPLLRR